MTLPFQFNQALVRNAAPSVENGLRAIDCGTPTQEGVQVEAASRQPKRGLTLAAP